MCAFGAAENADFVIILFLFEVRHRNSARPAVLITLLTTRISSETICINDLNMRSNL